MTAERPPEQRAGSTVSERGAKIAAARLGITVEEYRRHEAEGEHWCPICERWRPVTAFNTNRHTARGLTSRCRACHAEYGADYYRSIPRHAGPSSLRGPS